MSFYVFTTAEGMHFRHSQAPRLVALLDNGMGTIGEEFRPLGDDYDCAASVESGLFALGYWRTAALQVYDLRSGEERASFPFRKLATLRFDESGRRLFFKSGSQVWLLDLGTAESTRVRSARAIDSSIALRGQNKLISPSSRRGEVLQISLENGAVLPISLPIDATFFDIKPNPSSSFLVLIDRRKGIHCVDMLGWRVVWSVSLRKMLGKDHVGVGQFSGNGDLFGAAVAAFDHNYTVVLNAVTGRIMNRIESTCDDGLPLRENMVRSNATKDNTYEADTLDFLTGEERVVSLVG